MGFLKYKRMYQYYRVLFWKTWFWLKGIKTKFPFIKQIEENDCGVACIKMILEYYNLTKSVNYKFWKNLYFTEIGKNGISMLDISDVFEVYRFTTLGVKITDFDTFENIGIFPFIFYYKKHFIVVWKIVGDKIIISDPANKLGFLPKKNFEKILYNSAILFIEKSINKTFEK